MEEFAMKIIAKMKSDFPSKFGIPRQSGLVNELRSTIIFEPEYRNDNALRGLVDYSHLWIIWQFSQAIRDSWTPTVRPPRLGGNTRMGVFATRSPFRPNPLGLSCVKILGIERTQNYGTVIHVAGADLMDSTPIFDIKPYIPYCDCHPDAIGGFTQGAQTYILDVYVPDDQMKKIPKDKHQALLSVLSHDPRPSYQNDPERIYGMTFSKCNILFSVKDGRLTVHEIQEL